MGIFYENVVLINRAPINLTVTFDGQSKTLVPGENVVPASVVDFAKNQNPIMGSFDPDNPHISGGRYLVGIKDSSDPAEETAPLTKAEWEDHMNRPCRDNEEQAFQERYGSDPKAKMVLHGKGRKSTANSRTEAGGGAGPANATFSGRD
jgi:hypothetical protein